MPIPKLRLHHRASHFAQRTVLLCVAATCAAIGASRANAQTLNTTFGAPGFTCSYLSLPTYCASQSNNRPAPALLTVGDFWNQSVTGSGLASVSQLKISLVMTDVLVGASTMRFAVLLNSAVVGSTAVFGSNNFAEITAPYTFNFAAVQCGDV